RRRVRGSVAPRRSVLEPFRGHEGRSAPDARSLLARQWRDGARVARRRHIAVAHPGGGDPPRRGAGAGNAALGRARVGNAPAAGGAIGRRFSQRTIYLTGIAMYTATMLAWAATQNPEIVAILRAASGVAFALVYPSLVVITGKLVPRELRNTGQVLLGTSRDL